MKCKSLSHVWFFVTPPYMGILQAKILEWVAVPSRGSFLPRDQTEVSCIAGRFFTSWATKEAFGIMKKTNLNDFPLKKNKKTISEKIHGLKYLWVSLGCEESDTTERLHFHFSLSCTGEGNGSPLQYSCPENPRDGSLVGCCVWGRTELDTTDVT